MKLIFNWKQFWKFWSVQLGILGSAIAGVFISFPDVALSTWEAMPDEIKLLIPQQYMPLIGVAVFVLSLLSRLVKQNNLDVKETDNVK